MNKLFAVAGAVLVVLALVESYRIDFTTLQGSGSVDLRNRITGARLLVHQIDPYHYIWHPGEPAEFCDTRNNPNLAVSKTTVTPPLLALYLPLAQLPYRLAQFAWLYAQWLLLMGTLWLWIRAGATRAQSWLMAAFVTGLTYTPGWRWEAERGQTYVLLGFLFAWWLTMSRDARHGFWPGFLAGLLVAFRPPFALLLAFIAIHRCGQWLGAVAGLLAGLVLPTLLLPAVWPDYFSAMQTNSENYRHGPLPPRPAHQGFPASIEGTPTTLLEGLGNYPFVDVTVYGLARRFGFKTIPELPPLLIFSAAFLAWLWISRRFPPARLLPALAAWLFLADFILPTTRWGYYDVLILNVVLAGVVLAPGRKCGVWTCLLWLPAAWACGFIPSPPLWLRYAAEALLAVGAILSLSTNPCRTAGQVSPMPAASNA